jgi:hypothetical protein
MRSDAKAMLRKLVDTKIELDAYWSDLDKRIGLATESPFGLASWKPIEHLIECVSMLVNDEFNSVSWFILDNEYGRKGMEHSMPDGTMKRVKTIDDLLDVLGF